MTFSHFVNLSLMGKKVVIVGGGIIGLCSAYYLQKEGHEVTIVDKSAMNEGASYVNAGYISPSHVIPLAAPGVMKQGLKWMFDSNSPLYIKPRLDMDFLKWAWAFNKACSKEKVEKSVPVLKDICVFGQELYEEIKREGIFDFHMENKGLLMLCKTESMLEKELKLAEIAIDQGLECKELSLDELKALEPNASMDVIGATHFTGDTHSTPHEFMDGLVAYLEKNRVKILKNEEVVDINFNGEKITSIQTVKQEIKADEFVIAAGSWSAKLSKKIGLNLLLEAGKGYRINTTRDLGITIPAILAEAKVAVTPMNGFTRFAGTMEIAGISNKINDDRVWAIAKAAHYYYPEILLTPEEQLDAECGLRPLSFDGVPYIGRSRKCKNVVFATGHAMLGWTLGTSTGKLVSEIISDQKSSLNLEPFNPDRRK